MWRLSVWIGSFSLASVLAAQPPAGMVLVPGGEFRFRQFNRWREGVSPLRLEVGPMGQLYVIDQVVTLKPFFIDRTEVTNAQYKKFIDSSGYKPNFAEFFLNHWRDGSPTSGQAQYPVTWVDLGDAKAYCSWAGKALPSEEQWQMAAQGTDGRLYPWGNDPDLTKANVRSSAPRPVGSYPQGASPYGVLDMVGNVWEWTDSKADDGRHWYSYLRGGAWYQALTSVWYTDAGLMTNNQRQHFWWQSPGLNRTSTIGFRCVQAVK